MSRDYLQKPLSHVRRKDRAKDEVWIGSFLETAPFATLAMVQDQRPLVNSNIFVYVADRNAIYFHTAAEGRTRAVIEQNPAVCLSISEMGRLLPADVALEFSVEYSGVAVFGKAVVVTEEEEAYRALQLLLDKYFPHLQPGKDYRPAVPEELKRTTVFRIDIEHWSGKQKKVEADFPGAFFYPIVPGKR